MAADNITTAPAFRIDQADSDRDAPSNALLWFGFAATRFIYGIIAEYDTTETADFRGKCGACGRDTSAYGCLFAIPDSRFGRCHWLP